MLNINQKALRQKNILAGMVLCYDKDVHSYINPEILSSLQDNKWFKLLSFLPKEYFWLEDDSMHELLFIIKNDNNLDLTDKLTIVRYFSGSHYGWNDHHEGFIQEFFSATKYSNKVYPRLVISKQWSFVQNLCKKHSSECYQDWKSYYDKQRNNEYKRQSRASSKKQEFLASSIYQFIKQLVFTEDETIMTTELYEQYTNFCTTIKHQPVPQRSFGRTLNIHSIVSFRYRKGLAYKLNQEYDNDNDRDINQFTISVHD